MKRRTFIENSLLASASLALLPESAARAAAPPASTPYRSNWKSQQDRIWIDESLWANRLQDWRLHEGGLECIVRGRNRSVALLTHELGPQRSTFNIKVGFKFLNQDYPTDYLAVRLGSKGPVDDHRSAAIYGAGLNVGVRADGKWVIGDKILNSDYSPDLSLGNLSLYILGTPLTNGDYNLTLRLADGASIFAESKDNRVTAEAIIGGLALVSHADIKSQQEITPGIRFEEWLVEGNKVNIHEDHTYGPIYFAQYTLSNGTVKLSAACAPMGSGEQKVTLELKQQGNWVPAGTSLVDPVSRVAAFRLADWKATEAVEYRLVMMVAQKGDAPFPYWYEGSIAPAPPLDQPIKLGLFSCNFDHGFPDADLRKNILYHDVDAALFLGDQFYEASGGFGVETTTLERSILDYLRKWQQFGWSYRDLFQHVPCISIPDDHDVYHGNVWGEGGKAAPAEGNAYQRQDAGGYKMHPDWVTMVQDTQCSHLPDPYDPTPVKQDISVYYTHWNWGPLSFAIIEDRKFKSAPKNIFPVEAGIQNGFITNPDFKDESYLNAPNAELYGNRQEKFLEEWTKDWKNSARMKILLSQTNLCTLATLPAGSTSDAEVPSLKMPAPGEYVTGDAPTRDMDSNGWPHSKRNRAADIIRRGFTLHLAGDQHLASVIRYGVDTHDDGSFAFAGPALNNVWPRRWWPTLPPDHQPLPGKPRYTGKFEDGFKNKITVHAAANPRDTGLKPAIIHDRVTGYGIVKIDPSSRQITMECWKRSADPAQPAADAQYEGWPMTIAQTDNYARKPYDFLPEIQVADHADAVVQIINETTKTVEYTLRIKGDRFTPPVFEKAKYTVRVGEPDIDKWQEFKGVRPGRKGKRVLKVSLG
ncbi:alkaline phosphatase D family protein [Persicitalea sp.]|uniref:alkaline phosphatase D family protein n=1 Tax=Persicitalea sp. TaxID=3100273 RepID=UPI003594137F